MTDIDRDRRRLLRGFGTAAGAIAIAGCSSLRGESGERADEQPVGGSSSATDSDAGTDLDSETDSNTGTDTESSTVAESETRDVTIQSDAGEVAGTVYGDGDCAVVLAPQINLDRESWAPQANRLAEEGHLVLAVDPIEDDRPASLVGVVEYLQSEEAVENVTLVGASIGGEASVIAAAEKDQAVDGVVGISASGGEDRVADIDARSLFAVAEDDDDRFVETAKTLHERAPAPTDMVRYGGAAHGQGLFDTDNSEDLYGRISGLVGVVCS